MLYLQTFPSRRIVRLLSLILVMTGGMSTTAHAWDGYVERVVDGDTIIVVPSALATADGAGVSVRLYGIEAPEMNQPGGKESKDSLAALVEQGAKVEIIPIETDKYDRSVALVGYQGGLLNREQIKLGQAIVSERYCRAHFCHEWKKLGADHSMHKSPTAENK